MKNIVIKVGGSVIYEQGLKLNTFALEKLKEWYMENHKEYQKICFVVGGGKLSREVGGIINGYIKKDDDRHGIAMELTQTNALIIKGYLGLTKAYFPQTLGEAFEALLDDDCHTIVTGGLKRGWSTDMDAAIFADVLQEKKVHKLSNIEALYDKDPNQFPDAKKVLNINWSKYMKMFGISESNHTHKPNVSLPISSETAVFCKNKGISFHISGGKSFNKEWKLNRIMQSGSLVHP